MSSASLVTISCRILPTRSRSALRNASTLRLSSLAHAVISPGVSGRDGGGSWKSRTQLARGRDAPRWLWSGSALSWTPRPRTERSPFPTAPRLSPHRAPSYDLSCQTTADHRSSLRPVELRRGEVVLVPAAANPASTVHVTSSFQDRSGRTFAMRSKSLSA